MIAQLGVNVQLLRYIHTYSPQPPWWYVQYTYIIHYTYMHVEARTNACKYIEARTVLIYSGQARLLAGQAGQAGQACQRLLLRTYMRCMCCVCVRVCVGCWCTFWPATLFALRNSPPTYSRLHVVFVFPSPTPTKLSAVNVYLYGVCACVCVCVCVCACVYCPCTVLLVYRDYLLTNQPICIIQCPPPSQCLFSRA